MNENVVEIQNGDCLQKQLSNGTTCYDVTAEDVEVLSQEEEWKILAVVIIIERLVALMVVPTIVIGSLCIIIIAANGWLISWMFVDVQIIKV